MLLARLLTIFLSRSRSLCFVYLDVFRYVAQNQKYIYLDPVQVKLVTTCGLLEKQLML